MDRFQQYIIREVLKPLMAITVILIGLFSSFSCARYLARAATETLGSELILNLVFLKTLIAMEVLFPIALYASIIVALGRLYRDQEIIVMHSVGLGEFYIIKTVLMIALPLAVVVGLYSAFIRPWAYEAIYRIDAGGNTELDLDRYQSGRFYGNEDSGRIIYISEATRDGKEVNRIFYYVRGSSFNDIVIADDVYQEQPDPFQPPQLHLHDGFMYRVDRSDLKDTVTRFNNFVYLPELENTTNYRRKAASTIELSKSDDPGDIAEYQWRLSRFFATVLLALMSIPLSRSSPRQGKSEKVLWAAIIFAVYYNLSGLAQTWVEQAVVGEFPGIWWLHSLMFLVVVYFVLPVEFRRSKEA